MIRAFILILLLLITVHVNSQDIEFNNYSWEENPVLHELSKTETNKPEIILLDKNWIEIVYGDDNIYEYKLRHRIIRVNTDEAINNNNRIYLPISTFSVIVDLKARVISGAGIIKELNKESVKKAIDEENNSVYYYFAIEGIETGTEIEYFYIVKSVPYLSGVKKVMQSEVFSKNVELKIVSPSNLFFKSKSYNDFPELIKDTLDNKKNVLYANMDIVEGIMPEKYAAYDANLMYVIYKIDSNSYTGSSDIILYENAANSIGSAIYCNYSKKDKKKIEKFVEEMEIDASLPEEEKIRQIENVIKTQIFYSADDYLKSGIIADVIDNKIAGEQGIIRLYAAVFNKLNIPNEIVLTTDRFEIKFDKEFEAYNFLDIYIFYFPELEMYLVPTNTYYRLGYIPPNYSNNYGLFISTLKIGEYCSHSYELKLIPSLNYSKNVSLLEIEVDFSDLIIEPIIDYKITYSGYFAQSYQPFYDYFTEDMKEDSKESIIKSYAENADIIDIETENEGTEYLGIEPFIVNAKIRTSEYVQKAASNYLFEIGNLIGTQVEMYQEKERQFEVENYFNRSYLRKIRFMVPEGYKVKNLEKLNINFTYKENGEETMGFISGYSIDDDYVEININEFYKNITYPVAQIEDYRKIINAAADFNKITLLFEKM